MALAALSALLLSLTVFRNGSLNNDEGVYLLQAHELLHGHLLAPTAGGDASQPWLFAPVDGGYASKYLPLLAALYAVGLLVSGHVWPVTVLLAAAVPWLVFRLARRCGISERRAVVAAALVALSPAVLVQGGLALSYLPFLVTMLTCWLLAVRLSAVGAQPWAPGLAAALGFAMRPLDAVVLCAPVVLWAVLVRSERWRALGRAALGAAPVGVAVAAYNAVVTGSPTRMPFSLLTPDDAVGFGDRRLYPEDPLHPFHRAESELAMKAHFWTEPRTWFAAALVVLVLAGVAVLQRRTTQPTLVIAATAVPFLAAYSVFWGPWSASINWTGTRVVGPFYALPLIPVLALLAVQAQIAWRRVLVPVLVVAVAIGLWANVRQGERALDQARTDASRTATLLEVAEHAHERGPLLVDADPPYLGHPVSRMTDLLDDSDEPLLSASVLRPDQVAALVPTTSLLQLPEDPYFPGRRLSYRLVDVVLERGPAPHVAVDSPGTVLVVERGGVGTACASAGPVQLTVGPSVQGCSGAALPPGWDAEPYRRCLSDDCLMLAAYRVDPGGALVRVAWRRTTLAQGSAGWVVPVDGRVREQRGGGWLAVRPVG